MPSYILCKFLVYNYATPVSFVFLLPFFGAVVLFCFVLFCFALVCLLVLFDSVAIDFLT